MPHVARPHVTHIEAELKVRGAYELDRHTLIVGRTGSGKSTLINALEFALTGAASDIAGRALVKDEGVLIRLAPNGGPRLFAKATFSDGGVASREIVRTATGKVKKPGSKGAPAPVIPPGMDPDKVFPLRDVLEGLTGAPATARRFLLSQTVDGVTMDDILRLIPTEQHARFKELHSDQLVTASPTDKLLAVLERAKARAAASSKESEVASKLGVTAAAGLPPPPLDKDVEAARAEANAAKIALFKADEDFTKAEAAVAPGAAVPRAEIEHQYASAQQRLANATAAREACVARFLAASTAHDEAKAAYAAAPAPAANDTNRAAAAQTLRWHVKEAADECLVCGTAPGAAAFEARLVMLEQAIAGREAAARLHRELGDAVVRANASVEAAQREGQAARVGLDQATAALEAAKKLYDATAAAPTADPATLMLAAVKAGDACDAAKLRDDAAAAALRELEDRRLQWATASKASTTVARQSDIEGAAYEALTKSCNTVVEQLVVAAVRDFEKKVQLNLPPEYQFGLRLRDGETEVAQYGIMRHGFLNTAMSGGEWAMVISALASACAPKSGPCLIIPPDRALDPITLSAIMQAFLNADGQVIMTSTVMPSHIPLGWTVINRESAPMIAA